MKFRRSASDRGLGLRALRRGHAARPTTPAAAVTVADANQLHGPLADGAGLDAEIGSLGAVFGGLGPRGRSADGQLVGSTLIGQLFLDGKGNAIPALT